jgi:hypothetical protein
VKALKIGGVIVIAGGVLYFLYKWLKGCPHPVMVLMQQVPAGAVNAIGNVLDIPTSANQSAGASTPCCGGSGAIPVDQSHDNISIGPGYVSSGGIFQLDSLLTGGSSAGGSA